MIFWISDVAVKTNIETWEFEKHAFTQLSIREEEKKSDERNVHEQKETA